MKKFPTDGYSQIENLGRTNAWFYSWRRRFDRFEVWLDQHSAVKMLGCGILLALFLAGLDTVWTTWILPR